MTDTSSPAYLTPAEAATVLRVSRSTLYELLARGAVPHVRLSARVVRIPSDELHRWMREHVQGAK